MQVLVALIAAAGLAAGAAVRPARAGNLDATFLSDEAVMLGGAVTAVAGGRREGAKLSRMIRQGRLSRARRPPTRLSWIRLVP
jgi:hypothetical protein